MKKTELENRVKSELLFKDLKEKYKDFSETSLNNSDVHAALMNALDFYDLIGKFTPSNHFVSCHEEVPLFKTELLESFLENHYRTTKAHVSSNTLITEGKLLPDDMFNDDGNLYYKTPEGVIKYTDNLKFEPNNPKYTIVDKGVIYDKPIECSLFKIHASFMIAYTFPQVSYLISEVDGALYLTRPGFKKRLDINPNDRDLTLELNNVIAETLKQHKPREA